MLQKKYALLVLLFLCAMNTRLNGQDTLAKFDPHLKIYVYTFVEKPPTFPGGDEALAKYLLSISYPKEQLELQGKLNLSFVVDTSGNLLDKCIQNKKVPAYTLLDKAGLTLLDKMPKWIPGEQQGKKVAVRFLLPIFVCLQED